ncbi:MAG: hypothetical protein QW594_03895 [Candidatus Woesearchaeota archaeon]
MARGYSFYQIYHLFLYYVLGYAVLGIILSLIYLFPGLFNQLAYYLWPIDLITFGIAITIFFYALFIRASAIYFIFPLYFIIIYLWLILSAYYSLMPQELSSGFVIGFMFFTSFFELLFSLYLLRKVPRNTAPQSTEQQNVGDKTKGNTNKNKPKKKARR